MGTTTNFALPYPANSDGPFGPAQIQALATAVDSALKITAVSSATVLTTETTTSTTFTNLATSGPVVTLTTGTRALVGIGAQINVSTAAGVGLMGFAVTSPVIAATDDDALYLTSSASNDGYGAMQWRLVTGLTTGSTTFTAKYRTSAGTGTFRRRNLIVVGLI